MKQISYVLDLLLMPRERVCDLVSIVSDPYGGVASHHFPVLAVIRTRLEAHAKIPKASRPDWATLKNPEVRAAFLEECTKSMPLLRETTNMDESAS